MDKEYISYSLFASTKLTKIRNEIPLQLYNCGFYTLELQINSYGYNIIGVPKIDI